MSDTMLLGVLRMPPNLWFYNDPFDNEQRHQRYVEAADRIERLQRAFDIMAETKAYPFWNVGKWTFGYKGKYGHGPTPLEAIEAALAQHKQEDAAPWSTPLGCPEKT